MVDRSLNGKIFTSKGYGDFEVIDHKNWRNVKVKFVDTNYTTTTRVDKVLTGAVRDRLFPSVFGVGVLGSKDLSSSDKQHHLWSGMLQRCHCDKYQAKKPTYVGCTVSEYFKRYDNFHEWCENQVGFDQEGWHLDKDLLVKGNKIYSEDFCVFVPHEINTAIVTSRSFRGDSLIGLRLDKRSNKFQARVNKYGKSFSLGYFEDELEAFSAYKQAKEDYLKELANKWEDQIDPRVCQALNSYQVEITD